MLLEEHHICMQYNKKSYLQLKFFKLCLVPGKHLTVLLKENWTSAPFSSYSQDHLFPLLQIYNNNSQMADFLAICLHYFLFQDTSFEENCRNQGLFLYYPFIKKRNVIVCRQYFILVDGSFKVTSFSIPDIFKNQLAPLRTTCRLPLKQS